MARCLILVVALFVWSSVSTRAQSPGAASDPFSGTWKLNVAKSTFRSGPPPAAATTDVRTFSTMDGGWHVFQLVGVTAEGTGTLQVLAYKIDGERYPVHNGTTLAAFLATGKQTTITRSYRRVDSSTVEFITYTDGVASPPGRRTVSKDGKTYTQIIQAPNAKGELVENVSVFDRVR
jgi:hypothetical protein